MCTVEMGMYVAAFPASDNGGDYTSRQLAIASLPTVVISITHN